RFSKHPRRLPATFGVRAVQHWLKSVDTRPSESFTRNIQPDAVPPKLRFRKSETAALMEDSTMMQALTMRQRAHVASTQFMHVVRDLLALVGVFATVFLLGRAIHLP